MSKTKPGKTPSRTWVLVIALGTPLTVVIVGAFIASFRALTDVGMVNGVQPAWLLPVVVDVGMITTNIAAVMFRTRGLTGRWWANVMFLLFAAVSVFANVAHAQLAADFTRTSLLQATIISALFPVAQLGLTHLVMMLIPDEKERAKLVTQRESHRERELQTATVLPSPSQVAAVTVAEPQNGPETVHPLRLVETAPQPRAALSEVRAMTRDRVLQHLADTGERPTGATVGEWLGGKSAKTGQRFLSQLEEEGLLAGDLQYATAGTP